MRAVVQRVSRAAVRSAGELTGAIDLGLCVLLGAARGDGPDDVAYLVDKIVGLRIFEDAEGKMNLGLQDVGGALLVVSQFTLLGDARKGRRPSFIDALGPDEARALCDQFVDGARARGVRVETGRFRTEMQVELVNEGPVTLLLDSKKLF